MIPNSFDVKFFLNKNNTKEKISSNEDKFHQLDFFNILNNEKTNIEKSNISKKETKDSKPKHDKKYFVLNKNYNEKSTSNSHNILTPIHNTSNKNHKEISSTNSQKKTAQIHTASMKNNNIKSISNNQENLTQVQTASNINQIKNEKFSLNSKKTLTSVDTVINKNKYEKSTSNSHNILTPIHNISNKNHKEISSTNSQKKTAQIHTASMKNNNIKSISNNQENLTQVQTASNINQIKNEKFSLNSKKTLTSVNTVINKNKYEKSTVNTQKMSLHKIIASNKNKNPDSPVIKGKNYNDKKTKNIHIVMKNNHTVLRNNFSHSNQSRFKNYKKKNGKLFGNLKENGALVIQRKEKFIEPNTEKFDFNYLLESKFIKEKMTKFLNKFKPINNNRIEEISNKLVLALNNGKESKNLEKSDFFSKASLSNLKRNEMFHKILEQIKNNLKPPVKNEITIQLKPENLGKLKIMLFMENNKVNAKIITEHHNTQQTLLNNFNQLESALKEKGVNLSNFSVTVSNEEFSNKNQRDKTFKNNFNKKTKKVFSLFDDTKIVEDNTFIRNNYISYNNNNLNFTI